MNRVAVEHEAAEEIAADCFDDHHGNRQQNADQKRAPLRRAVKLIGMMMKMMMMPAGMRMPMIMMMSMRMSAMTLRSERPMFMKRIGESFAVLHIRLRQSSAMILLTLRGGCRIISKAYRMRHVKRHERRAVSIDNDLILKSCFRMLRLAGRTLDSRFRGNDDLPDLNRIFVYHRL
ncbi:MAG: hypothetical protein OXT69_13920 [Candidatus Poribacteria bacterium]|nr:hypothetical protein [Candidatus Poribacteria bacterium]